MLALCIPLLPYEVYHPMHHRLAYTALAQAHHHDVVIYLQQQYETHVCPDKFPMQDLAARNVLVGDGEVCKVSDFGLLRELPKGDAIYHSKSAFPWPIRWMAPESLRDRVFSQATDVWSFGVLQWEMFNPKEKPYKTFTHNQQVPHYVPYYRGMSRI